MLIQEVKREARHQLREQAIVRNHSAPADRAADRPADHDGTANRPESIATRWANRKTTRASRSHSGSVMPACSNCRPACRSICSASTRRVATMPGRWCDRVHGDLPPGRSRWRSGPSSSLIGQRSTSQRAPACEHDAAPQLDDQPRRRGGLGTPHGPGPRTGPGIACGPLRSALSDHGESERSPPPSCRTKSAGPVSWWNENGWPTALVPPVKPPLNHCPKPRVFQPPFFFARA